MPAVIPDKVFMLIAKSADSAPSVALQMATFAPVEAIPLMLVPAFVVSTSVIFFVPKSYTLRVDVLSVDLYKPTNNASPTAASVSLYSSLQ